MWKYLKHPNILPFLGVTISPLQLISDWMACGTLREYIKKQPEADRLGLVGLSLVATILRLPRKQLSDVARGLHHLHSCNVIHRGIKGVRGRSEPCFTSRVDTRLAKHSRGWLWSCGHRGFFRSHYRQGRGFSGERLGKSWIYRQMDRTGDFERRGI
jgi:hypothetical protein